jgi:hypothetical protein
METQSNIIPFEDLKHNISPDMLISVILNDKTNKGGSFTIVSRKTGKHYTYKISRKEYKGKYYTHIWVMYVYKEFKHLGVYDKYTNKIYKKRDEVMSESAKAICWVLNQVLVRYETGILNNKLAVNVEMYHTGNCMRCGRELTDPDSIERGLGPVCISLGNKKGRDE